MCFGGGGNDTQEVVQRVELPPGLQNFNNETYRLADVFTKRDYQTYPGQRIAQFSPDQLAGFDATRAAQGAWQPAFGAATGAATDVAGREVTSFPEANVQDYMDPFLSNVLGRSLEELNRDFNIDLNQAGGRMAQAGAFDGSRHGIVEGQMHRNKAKVGGDLIANLTSAAWDDAVRAFYADQSNQAQNDALRLSAANQLGNLGAAQQGLAYGDAAALLDIGAAQQNQEQRGLDTAYADFMRQWQYPLEMLNVRTGVASGNPYGATTFSEQLMPNRSAQNIGSLAALAGGVGQFATGLAPFF